MRPVGIELEGFSVYSRRVSVDFSGVDFFSLTGPTGSGKSSLIDAMVFALYGRVPRLGGRAVAPVITAGADRARVSLDFEVRDERYLVSRVAERTDTGAAVREARLEKADGTSVASGAGDVTRQVEELLRLRFEDFTKTVVLPQGEFARFLNAGSRERRDLLRDLLGLDVYALVRDLANARKTRAAARADSARSQLSSLEVPEADDVEGARSRLAGLQELSAQIGSQLADLGKAETDLAAAEKQVEDLSDARRRLSEIAPPEHLEEMNERVVAAREAVTLATEALGERQEEEEALRSEIEKLPGSETMSNIRRTHQELTELEERLAGLDIDQAGETVEKTESALARAESELADAENAMEGARVSHAAHTVSATLAVGEPCPVCAREVETLPEAEPPPELTELEDVLAGARSAVAASREELQSARARFTEVQTRASEMTDQREKLAERLTDAPPLEELAVAAEKLAGLGRALAQVQSAIADLETARRHAQREHEDAAEAVRTVGRVLMVAREQVADLKPPHSESDDPMVQWKEFLNWRDEVIEQVSEARRSLRDHLERMKERLEQMRSNLVDALVANGVPAEKPYEVTLAREMEVARNVVVRMEEVTERAKSLRAELEEAGRGEAVAAALANHLRADGFERWLMAGAITGLVKGANELLSQLSGGGYSLESDEEGSFQIIDHRNANEVREVATLSGGETFLVSLALSLSLAETLSAAGGGGLDAIILDEGFGTLDEESLDVVAAVLEELAGRGLMVGVITHVKELAARAPVRYRVTREPGGSEVEVLAS